MYILYRYMHIYIYFMEHQWTSQDQGRPPVDIFVTRFSGRATYHPWVGWGCPRWTVVFSRVPRVFLEGFSGFCCWKLPQGSLWGGIWGGEYRIFVVGKIYMCIIFALFWSLWCHPHHWLSLATCYLLLFLFNPQGTLTFRSLKRVVRFKGWSFASRFGMLPVNLGSLSWSGRVRGGYPSKCKKTPQISPKTKKGHGPWAVWMKLPFSTASFAWKKLLDPFGPWWSDGLLVSRAYSLWFRTRKVS